MVVRNGTLVAVSKIYKSKDPEFSVISPKMIGIYLKAFNDKYVKLRSFYSDSMPDYLTDDLHLVINIGNLIIEQKIAYIDKEYAIIHIYSDSDINKLLNLGDISYNNFVSKFTNCIIDNEITRVQWNWSSKKGIILEVAVSCAGKTEYKYYSLRDINPGRLEVIESGNVLIINPEMTGVITKILRTPTNNAIEVDKAGSIMTVIDNYQAGSKLCSDLGIKLGRYEV